MKQTGAIGWCGFLVTQMVAPAWVQADFKTPVAVTDVRIVTEAGLVIESGTILMADGRIVDFGTDVAVPAYAERIDGTGLTAYPGFIDAHTHLGMPDPVRTSDERERTEDVNPDHSQGPLPATRFANRRGIRPQLRVRDGYVPDDSQLGSHRGAGFTAALIAPRDGILAGTSDLMALSGQPIRRSVLAPDIAMHGSFATGEDGEYPQTILGIIAQYRQVMLDAEWYVKQRKYVERHPGTATRAPLDPALEALQPLRARTQRLVFEANSEQEIRRALKLAGEFNLDVAISGAKEAWKVIDVLKDKRVPLIVSLDFGDEPEFGKKKKDAGARRPGAPGRRRPNPPEDDADDEKQDEGDEVKEKDKAEDKKIYEPLKVRQEQRRLWEEKVANVIRLHEAGVPFALRTRDLKTPGELFTNLHVVIERGLPESAAVTALTAYPAQFAGVSDQIGTIARGHLANITLMTKSLADEKAKVKFVFIDGEKFDVEADKKKSADGPPGRPGMTGRRGGGRGFGRPGGMDRGDREPDADEPVAEDTEDKTESEETGPTFASEIEADRVPATHTGGSVLITGATIIPVTSETLTDASILIVDGKIAAIGRGLSAPADVTVIDATGKFVIPGLVDCHSHLGIDGVNESALAISAEVRIEDLINPTEAGIFRAVAGGTTTHHVMHGSANPIGGQNAIVKTKYGRSADEMLVAGAPRTLKFALGENVTRANSAGRGRPGAAPSPRRFPGSRMGVEAVIRAALESGKAYRAEWDDYRRRLEAGQDVPQPRHDLRLEALAEVLDGSLTVHAHCYRSEEILRLLATAEDYGFRIGTLQHVLEGYRIAPEIARHGAGASTFSNFWAYKVEAFGAIPHNAALMTERGVNASVNSDSPDTIRYFGLEAAKCIKWGGLDENQALRLVTINPAMQLQIADRVGSLEVGKDGDVAIFNGHPLNTFSKCVMTLIEGEVYFEDVRPAATEPADTLTTPGDVDMTIPETPHRAYAIVAATVHPISGPVIENGTVVVVEDRIHAVGVDVPLPPGAGVIDGGGLHVYPGLIDAGGTLGLFEIGQTPVTSDSSDIATFAPHLRAASAVHPHSEHIRIARTAGITTALTKPSGGRIAGQSALIHLDGWTVDEMLVLGECGLHMSVPSKPVRPSRRRFRFGPPRPETDYEAETKKLGDYIDQAKRYAAAKEAAAADPTIDFTVDLALEAMIPYVQGERPVIFSADSYKEMIDTIEFAEKHKLRCVLSGATQAWKIANLLAEKDIAVILGTAMSYPRGEFEPWDSIYRCAGELERAGVRFCFASESASGAYNLGMQAGMAVAHGLTKDAAERALTLGAAGILGVADRIGSIEVGKVADLIVTTDTPLQAASVVTHMFVAGRPVELTSMHTENYEKFRNRPEPDLPPLPELVGPPSLTAR